MHYDIPREGKVLRMCIKNARVVRDAQARAAWLQFFRGEENDYPLFLSLKDFLYMLDNGPKVLNQDFSRVTRKQFADDYLLLHHGGEIRQRALRRLCQRAVVWNKRRLNRAWEYSSIGDIQLLLQSWKEHKADVNKQTWQTELHLIKLMFRRPGTAVCLSNVPGMMEMLVDFRDDSVDILLRKYGILAKFARDTNFMASSRSVEAMPLMICVINLKRNMVFKYIDLVYITRNRLREAYLYPGLVDALLLLVQKPKSDPTDALNVLEKLSRLPENKHDMATRVGCIENMIHGVRSGSVKTQGECGRILLRLKGRNGRHFGAINARETIDQTWRRYWLAVQAIWILRSPRFALRLRGSPVTKKLPPELARMVFKMLF